MPSQPWRSAFGVQCLAFDVGELYLLRPPDNISCFFLLHAPEGCEPTIQDAPLLNTELRTLNSERLAYNLQFSGQMLIIPRL